MDEIQEEKHATENLICIRKFDCERDTVWVNEMERQCEAETSGGVSLYTDLMGDPICRIRHSPLFIMLVAESGPQRDIVGVIRGSIKTVVCGVKRSEQEQIPVYNKAAYILGLRVAPSHRRQGIALRLVKELETWFKENGAKYAYMATAKDNKASINLFVEKCSFREFRRPAILVQPVHCHFKTISSTVKIIKLDVKDAGELYRKYMRTSEFFPQDIDAVLQNKLTLGTWMAFSSANTSYGATSWAVLSVWNTSDVFKLQVKGMSLLTRIYAAASRFLDRALPCIKFPSIPDIFHPFGVLSLYGLHAEGPGSENLMIELWWFVHNLAREMKDCRVIATELGGRDPLKSCIPHWKSFSCPEDIWCIKKLDCSSEDKISEDWSISKPGLELFVDPREI